MCGRRESDPTVMLGLTLMMAFFYFAGVLTTIAVLSLAGFFS